MQLLIDWNWKRERVVNRSSLTKYPDISALLPVVEGIVMNRCLLVEARRHPRTTRRLVSQLETEVRPFTYRVEILFNFSERFIRYSCSLSKNDRILSIGSRDLRINFAHKLLQHEVTFDYPYRIGVSQQTGEVQIVSLANYSAAMMESMKFIQQEVAVRLREVVEVCRSSLKLILEEINEIGSGEMPVQRYQAVYKIQKHIYFSCKDLGLSEKASSYRYPSEETLKKREEIIKRLLDSSQQGDQFAIKNGVLYGMVLQPAKITQNKAWKREFENNVYFQRMLQIPVSKNTSANENSFIYNDIEIEEPSKVVVQLLPMQENCSLKIGSISFHYLLNESKDSQDQVKTSAVSKLVIIKEGKFQTKRCKAKLLHEKNIVRILGSASSGYLTKYYHSSQKQFGLRNGLMMEYNPLSVSLADHLALKRGSLSLAGKLNLLAHISNGLRFLVYYRIVHMDLNLNNILVCDGYLPKIIDFGQAYQQQVVDSYNSKQAYLPGFTLPYCSPEVFAAKKSFSSSQDVFSFGVLMFRLLTNSLPYFPSDKLVQCYAGGNYHSKLMLAGERMEDMANWPVVCLLLQLIERCMCLQAQNRPLPIWCTIILKEIIGQLHV